MQHLLIVLRGILTKLKKNKRYHCSPTSSPTATSMLFLGSCCIRCSFFTKALQRFAGEKQEKASRVQKTQRLWLNIVFFLVRVCITVSKQAPPPVVSRTAVPITGSVSPRGGKLCAAQHPRLISLRLLDRWTANKLISLQCQPYCFSLQIQSRNTGWQINPLL